jgi:putative ABC transport system permease protein
MLIIGTIVIANQMNFAKKTDLGFNKDAIVMMPIPVNDSTGKVKMETLKNKFLQVAGVQKVTFCMQAPASQSNNTTSMRFDNRPQDEKWDVNSKDADADYLPTFHLSLVAGRNIYPSDTVREFLVNETLVKKLNLKSAADIINKRVTIGGKTAPVVGVVKDFYNYSFRTDIAAVAIFSNYQNYYNCAVKIDLANTKATLTSFEKIWNQEYPEYVFSSQFLDERIAQFYELDDTMLKLIEAFAGIAIFIGCLGLYGLVSFMAVRKTKEIGVRKVLGASIQNILWLFGKEFTRLLLIAFLISAPLAWWAMHVYLQDFKYRTPLGAGIFALAILSTFAVAALTVGYRSIRAALTNPVKSLRSE